MKEAARIEIDLIVAVLRKALNYPLEVPMRTQRARELLEQGCFLFEDGKKRLRRHFYSRQS